MNCAATVFMNGFRNKFPENSTSDNSQVTGLGHSGNHHSCSIALPKFKLDIRSSDNTVSTTGDFSICCVPDLAKTQVKRLFSVSETIRLVGWRYTINGINESYLIIHDKTFPLDYAPRCGLFDIYLIPRLGNAMFSYMKVTPQKNLWHLRLGHLSVSNMDRTLKSSYVTGMTFYPGDVNHFL
jgi:hypothetical protein